MIDGWYIANPNNPYTIGARHLILLFKDGKATHFYNLGWDPNDEVGKDWSFLPGLETPVDFPYCSITEALVTIYIGSTKIPWLEAHHYWTKPVKIFAELTDIHPLDILD